MVQFDAVSEAVVDNLDKIKNWVLEAVEAGARWIMFHEGTVCDYTPRLAVHSADGEVWRNQIARVMTRS